MTDDNIALNGSSVARAPRKRSTFAWIFVGNDGPRAGWSIVLYFALVFLIGTASVLIMRSLFARQPGGGALEATQMMRAESIPAFAVIVAAALMSLIERRRFSSYGLTGRRWLPDLLIGAFWGLAMLSVLIGLLVATQSLSIDGIALDPQAAVISGLKWAGAFMLVGLFEEFLFRGYLQFTLARGIAGITRAISPTNARAADIGWFLAAVVLSIGLFAGVHASNTGETVLGLFGVALAGIIFAFSLWRTGSLWWAIGFHASWDWAQSFLYGVADSGQPALGHLLNTHAIGNPLLSGGSVGPEGSILLVPVLLASLTVIHLTLPKRDAIAD